MGGSIPFFYFSSQTRNNTSPQSAGEAAAGWEMLLDHGRAGVTPAPKTALSEADPPSPSLLSRSSSVGHFWHSGAGSEGLVAAPCPLPGQGCVEGGPRKGSLPLCMTLK